MDNRKKLYCVANAHLDTQWLWTIQDTIRDCVKNTLEKNFDLFAKYRYYHMNFEGAFRYKLAREYYPELYRKLREYIAEDRWSVAGSTVDAMDANVPSSEALMRQVLYGNGFFESEFGKKSCDIFLPDCFGFRYSLPSIARHMGLCGFSTQKLDWGVGSPLIHEDGTVTAPMPQNDVPEEKRIPQMDFESQNRGGKGVRCFYFNKNGSNGRQIAGIARIPENSPSFLLVSQVRSPVTKLAKAEILIQGRPGKGMPYVMAILDDVVTSLTVIDAPAEEPTA